MSGSSNFTQNSLSMGIFGNPPSGGIFGSNFGVKGSTESSSINSFTNNQNFPGNTNTQNSSSFNMKNNIFSNLSTGSLNQTQNGNFSQTLQNPNQTNNSIFSQSSQNSNQTNSGIFSQATQNSLFNTQSFNFSNNPVINPSSISTATSLFPGFTSMNASGVGSSSNNFSGLSFMSSSISTPTSSNIHIPSSFTSSPNTTSFSFNSNINTKINNTGNTTLFPNTSSKDAMNINFTTTFFQSNSSSNQSILNTNNASTDNNLSLKPTTSTDFMVSSSPSFNLESNTQSLTSSTTVSKPVGNFLGSNSNSSFNSFSSGLSSSLLNSTTSFTSLNQNSLKADSSIPNSNQVTSQISSLSKPTISQLPINDPSKYQRALIESIHHERLEDLVNNWEKRIQEKIKTFLQFADLLSEVDKNTILQTQKLVDLKKSQQISLAKQKNLTQILENIEQQQQKLSPILNSIEDNLKLQVSDYQDKNIDFSSILLNSQQLQRLDQQINEISDLFTKVSQTTQPDILFSINQSIAIQEASIEALTQQIENLESRLDSISNRLFK